MRVKVLSIASLLLFGVLFLSSVRMGSAQELESAQDQSSAQDTTTSLPADVLIINQVRGTECCSNGSLSILRQQVAKTIELGIPTHFVLRYDALQNDAFTNFLKLQQQRHPNLISFGALIEITPELAAQSGVAYNGSESTWFEAQQVFTIGYKPEDRTRLIDTVMKRYSTVFGSYPRLTTAWMIDTPSLNYLHEQYGVMVHQITREQWGTDSYFLYGGPPHYPYTPGEKWLFVPDYSREDAPLIVRQTVTDPVWTYGDLSSSFTSQPNDYVLDGKDFSYFTQLVKQAATQPSQKGFMLIGLENSMSQETQTEYERQLAALAELRDQKVITFPTLQSLAEYWKSQRITVYKGQDFVSNSQNHSWWITTNQYRVRLRLSQDELAITDLRIFDQRWEDPYTEYQAKNMGYWVIPYLLDGSMWQQTTSKKSPWWKRVLLPAQFEETRNTVSHDLPLDDVSRIVIAESLTQPPEVIVEPNSRIEFRFQRSGSTSSVFFDPQTIRFTATEPPSIPVFKPDTHPVHLKSTMNGVTLQWLLGQSVSHQATIDCADQECLLSFSSDPTLLATMRKEHYPFLFPEQIIRQLDAKKTILYVHNTYALAGRNPVRVVLVPYDTNGYVTTLADKPTVVTQPEISAVRDVTSSHQKIQYIDLINNRPAKVTTTVTAGDVSKQATVYFAPNCKETPSYCLKHPVQATWYIRTLFSDKLRATFGETQ